MSASQWRLDPRRTSPASGSSFSARIRRYVLRTIDRVRGRLGARVIRLPGRVIVLAESVDALRLLRRPLAVRRATVVVAWWRAPAPGWSGRVGPLPAVRRQRVSTHARIRVRGRGPATVDIILREAAPLSHIVSAAATALRPSRPLPPAPVGPAPLVRPVSPTSGRLLVDASRVNPRGRRLESYGPDAPRLTLEFAGRRPTLFDPWRRGVGPDLGWAAIGALRSVGAVTCARAPGHDPALEASVLVQLAMTGVVLHAPDVDDSVAALLAPPLREILSSPLPGAVPGSPRSDGVLGSPGGVLGSPGADGELAMEVRSVRQRRAALRYHSTRFGGDAAVPTVSALLATRRPEHLAGALQTIAAQSYPSVEIVVCLHGIDLPPVCLSYLEDSGRPYEVVSIPADVPFGTALGVASERAGGALITKFDDDDTYGPDHIWDLVLARHYSGATLVGKGAEFVFLEDAGLTIRRWSGRPESDDSVVAGGTMLIGKGDLTSLGGWRPVPRSVDRGLVDRIHREGATIYRTHPLEYLYHRRSTGHTWDPGTDFFLQNPRNRWPGPHLP